MTNKTKSIIVDIDGTIANITHRIHFIEDKKNADWDAFYDFSQYDIPIKNMVELINGLEHQGYTVLFATGRSEKIRDITINWLVEYKFVTLYWATRFSGERLFMRQKDDYRHDCIIKEEIYDKYITNHYDVKFVIEDRKRVVEMWRSKGLITFQCGEGDF